MKGTNGQNKDKNEEEKGIIQIRGNGHYCTANHGTNKKVNNKYCKKICYTV